MTARPVGRGVGWEQRDMEKVAVTTGKVKRLLSTLGKRLAPSAPPKGMAPLDVLVLAVLRSNATLNQALNGLEIMHQEFVDFNEMRVAPPKDIADLLGRKMSGARAKADRITLVLNNVYDHGNELDFEHMADMGKRQQRTHLREALGLDGFGEAYLMAHVFEAPSIPVDDRLLDKLKDDKIVGSAVPASEVRTMLERAIRPDGRAAAFELLALYAAERRKPAPKAKAPKKAPSAKRKKTTAKKAKTKTKKKAAERKTKAAKPSKPKVRKRAKTVAKKK